MIKQLLLKSHDFLMLDIVGSVMITVHFRLLTFLFDLVAPKYQRHPIIYNLNSALKQSSNHKIPVSQIASG